MKTILSLISIASLTVACAVEVQSPNLDDKQTFEFEEGAELDEDSLLELAGYETESGTEVEDGADSEVTDSTKSEVDSKLSSEAREVLQQVRAKRKEIRGEFADVCSIDRDLRKNMKEDFKAIIQDETLDREAKKSKAMEIIDANKEAIQADRQQFKDCVESNKDDFKSMKEAHFALAKACLVSPKIGLRRGLKKAGKRMERQEQIVESADPKFSPFLEKRFEKKNLIKAGRFAKKMKRRSEFKIERLETKLLSDECAAELGGEEAPAAEETTESTDVESDSAE